ncbi:hypothetical protein [Phytohabitans aurantiacus]|uniref:Uncharacterized protein n=1 Tax=Phytohabitans aurantiacus TaxID=3016789 RepID=A0ABQ5QNQ4_9ACTN|nr:hypothetical protein [Phytohabitans aurantiacus]GLH94920.1 hypothetical protein Pa4123_01920 [Phytohabitans aurantiacus]
MAELYPTKTRRALLDAIANAQVLTDITAPALDVILLFPNAPTEWQTRQTVTARVRELEAAGWVEEDDAGVEWRTTDAGEAARTGPAGPPGGYGPQQLQDELGLHVFQFDRALAAGLIPPRDAARGWSAATVAALTARAGEIRAAVGSVPDVGAVRAAELLSERFGVDVHTGAVLELSNMDLLPCVGTYKDHPLYCGRTLETFNDRSALDKAIERGRLHTADRVAAYFRVRRSDVDHLIRAGWLKPTTYVLGPWQRRRDRPEVALYRQADLDVLAEHPAIDWDAVRATPAGRPSQLARLTARQ